MLLLGEIFMFDLVQHRKPVKFEAFIMIIIVFFMLGYPMIGRLHGAHPC